MPVKKLISLIGCFSLAALVNINCASASAQKTRAQPAVGLEITVGSEPSNYLEGLKSYVEKENIDCVFLGTYKGRSLKYTAAHNTIGTFYLFDVDEVYIYDKQPGQIEVEQIEVVYPWLKIGDVAPAEAHLEALANNAESYGYREEMPVFHKDRKTIIFARQTGDEISLATFYHVLNRNLYIGNKKIPLQDFKNKIS